MTSAYNCKYIVPPTNLTYLQLGSKLESPEPFPAVGNEYVWIFLSSFAYLVLVNIYFPRIVNVVAPHWHSLNGFMLDVPLVLSQPEQSSPWNFV